MRTKNVIETKERLFQFLKAALPEEVPCHGTPQRMQSRDHFMADVFRGIQKSSMALRVS